MKPQLTLLPGKPSAVDIAKLFERITGRKPTEQEEGAARPGEGPAPRRAG